MRPEVEAAVLDRAPTVVVLEHSKQVLGVDHAIGRIGRDVAHANVFGARIDWRFAAQYCEREDEGDQAFSFDMMIIVVMNMKIVAGPRIATSGGNTIAHTIVAINSGTMERGIQLTEEVLTSGVMRLAYLIHIGQSRQCDIRTFCRVHPRSRRP
jgi:hypothetical protein